ncbi:hypothetical protein JXB27_04270 [Candidatus Woesearchaeota archaeon]|nr:hypothetical protein [Candidatus Woesearchaeota archaeon]
MPDPNDTDRWIVDVPYYDRRDTGVLLKPLEEIISEKKITDYKIMTLLSFYKQKTTWDGLNHNEIACADIDYLHRLYEMMTDKSDFNVSNGFDKAAEEVLRIFNITREKRKTFDNWDIPYCDECKLTMALERPDWCGLPYRKLNIPLDTYRCITFNCTTILKKVKGSVQEGWY